MPDYLDQFDASLNIERIVANTTIKHQHLGKTLVVSDSVTITVPPGLKKGTHLQIIPLGVCTLVAGSGVTINTPDSLTFSVLYVPILLFSYGANIWAATQGESGGGPASSDAQAYHIVGNTSNPVDGQTTYLGIRRTSPSTTANLNKFHFRRSGTITAAAMNYIAATAGSAEAISMYIRLNNTTDHLIQTVSVSANERIFSNDALDIDIVSGDYIEIKIVNPTWGTNPLNVNMGGYVYMI